MKRILAMLLCLAMIVGIMAACGNDSGNSSAPSSSKTEESSETSSTAEDSSSEAGEPSGEVVNDTNPGTELPIVTTPVTISIAKERHMLDTTKSYNEKASFKNIIPASLKSSRIFVSANGGNALTIALAFQQCS